MYAPCPYLPSLPRASQMKRRAASLTPRNHAYCAQAWQVPACCQMDQVCVHPPTAGPRLETRASGNRGKAASSTPWTKGGARSEEPQEVGAELLPTPIDQLRAPESAFVLCPFGPSAQLTSSNLSSLQRTRGPERVESAPDVSPAPKWGLPESLPASPVSYWG